VGITWLSEGYVTPNVLT